ncbi:hypothetical protein E2C01_038338 [Portunus trituberculatus]|uniref:Uncharacterized protein n=1 Tax=Portunus trituberculatus TaxID=210409 RepID=A0A5B7FAL0_PORTR|nr:hypothetical protein [Portunus trituberculatus]
MSPGQLRLRNSPAVMLKITRPNLCLLLHRPSLLPKEFAFLVPRWNMRGFWAEECMGDMALVPGAGPSCWAFPSS